MSVIYQEPYTVTPSRREQLENERAACIDYIIADPTNLYWQSRLASVVKQLDALNIQDFHRDELEAFYKEVGEQEIKDIDEWLRELDDNQLAFVQWIVDEDPRTPAQREMDDLAAEYKATRASDDPRAF